MSTGKVNGEVLTAFVAGDNEAARKAVLELARAIGFDSVDSGALKNARYLEPLAFLNIQLSWVLGKRSECRLQLRSLTGPGDRGSGLNLPVRGARHASL